MIHFIIWLIIGSAVSYFMQPQIRWFSEYVTKFKPFQTIIKILLDALLGVGWLIFAPALYMLVSNLKMMEEAKSLKEKKDEET